MEALSIKEIVKAINGVLMCGNEDIIIKSVSTNSKEIGEDGLFVPIIGERVDGHDYIENALNNGAKAIFTSKNSINIQNASVFIMVNDTLLAMQKLATYYRDKFKIPVIGITGSVGKTTTKEMIATALETKYKVLKTAGNMNSQIGVPLMMFQLSSLDEVAVIEMGMSEVGEMEKLAAIVKPSIAIMTNIGVSHIAQLKTQENIRKEKINIINEFSQDSILFVNGNDILLKEIHELSQVIHKESQVIHEKAMVHSNYTKNPQNLGTIEISKATLSKLKIANVYAYGTEEFCEYYASDIKTVGEETHFTFHYLLPSDDKKENCDENCECYNLIQATEEIILGVLGIHNVYNAVVSLAIAHMFHIPPNIAKDSLKEYRPIAMRGQIEEYHGIKVIDDTYNASPDSMKSGVSILIDLPLVKRRIAVLADVLELGEYSYDCHYGVGEYIAGKNIDLVITIGQEAKVITKALNQKDKKILTINFEQNEEAIGYLKSYLEVGDAVLIKGSRGMHTEEIVKALRQN